MSERSAWDYITDTLRRRAHPDALTDKYFRSLAQAVTVVDHATQKRIAGVPVAIVAMAVALHRYITRRGGL